MIEEIVEALIEERDRINRALQALAPKRRGRPSRISTAHSFLPIEKSNAAKESWTPERKAEQSKRSKAMWRKRKKAAKS